MTETKLTKQETLKKESHNLLGTLPEEMADFSAGDVTDDAYELLKFHGSYYGYDRDTATVRKKAGLEKIHEFMVRMKCPGGRLNAAQYLALDVLCEKYANATLRITTRETFQFHCVTKVSMKPFIAEINHLLLSTLGGCGDVNRNVLACPAPIKDAEHDKLEEDCFRLARVLAPRTNSYYEVWLDGERIHDYPFNPLPPEPGNVEPLYGDTYMPRKFKVAITTPDDNCTDAMTNDLAILSLFDGGKHLGYNLALGGGLGMTHNTPKTYPRIASILGYIPPEMLVDAAEAVIRLQRDHGDRGDRKHARLKYVVQEKGLEWTKTTLESYLGTKLEAPRPMKPWGVEDHMGWYQQGDGKWFLGIPIPSGRIIDRDAEAIRSGLREVILHYGMNLVLTADQNILLCDIEPGERMNIETMLRKHGIKLASDITNVNRNMLACVSYPTCGKALAEAERIQIPLLSEIENVMRRQGVIDEKIAIRIAGCPNGCSRPYVGDIGIVGRMPDHYALYVGGDFEGTRLNEKIFDKIPYEKLPIALEPMFALWHDKRYPDEGFGDFCARYGIDNVKEKTVAAIGEAWVK